ncbi:MAG TPA: hypothetical protein VG184_12835, partial [Acidimicrobiales bacterium]|nr:hypothetical protein [Acidimicrobiales bacterium]
STGSGGNDVVTPDGRLEGLDFDGLVEFTWVDRSGVHTARLPVQGAGGVVRIGVPGGSQAVEWPAAVGSLPSLAGKYHTTEASGPLVAGRPTTEMQIWSASGSRETLALDQATGLVLARAELDSDGSVVRSMVFDNLSLRLTHPPASPATSSAVGSSARPTTAPAPVRLSAEYSGPSQLVGGYKRVRVEPVSGGLRVVYSDGVHGLSIFEQPGRLSGSERNYPWAGGEVVTWQSGPTVFTAIGDGPSPDVLAAARSIPEPHQLSVLGHLRSLSREVVDTLSGSQ